MDKYWVAPCLTDGLGNRLFQLSCAKWYSEKYNKRLVFFLPRTKPTGHGDYDNIFKMFPEIPIVETESEWNEINEKDTNYYTYDELPFIEGNVVINGSRQVYNYITSINPTFPVDKQKLEKYVKPNMFFIHLRLGDFRILPHHQIDLQLYYSEAIKKIPQNVNILVFSNEPNTAKELFPNLMIVDEPELETLYLMSLCTKGSIVANSTFSYWGSYFSHKEDSVTIFPDSLGMGLPEPKDYYPPWAVKVRSSPRSELKQ
jgi:hypothetical protein